MPTALFICKIWCTSSDPTYILTGDIWLQLLCICICLWGLVYLVILIFVVLYRLCMYAWKCLIQTDLWASKRAGNCMNTDTNPWQSGSAWRTYARTLHTHCPMDRGSKWMLSDTKRVLIQSYPMLIPCTLHPWHPFSTIRPNHSTCVFLMFVTLECSFT